MGADGVGTAVIKAGQFRRKFHEIPTTIIRQFEMSVLIFLFSEYPIRSSGYGEPENDRVLALQSGDIVLGKTIA